MLVILCVCVCVRTHVGVGVCREIQTYVQTVYKDALAPHTRLTFARIVRYHCNFTDVYPPTYIPKNKNIHTQTNTKMDIHTHLCTTDSTENATSAKFSKSRKLNSSVLIQDLHLSLYSEILRDLSCRIYVCICVHMYIYPHTRTENLNFDCQAFVIQVGVTLANIFKKSTHTMTRCNTHTHTNTHTHAYTYTHRYTYIHRYTNKHMQNANAHTRLKGRTARAHQLRCVRTDTHTRTHTHVHAHAHTHTPSRIHTHTHICTRIHMRTHTH